MTTLLEPAMILAVGLVVGLIVFAILLPIFQFDAFAS
jgi:type II secretory pathway component PulF